LRSSEHFEDLQVGVAGILDVVAEVPLDVADVAPGLKFIVTAFGPVLKIVIVPLPLIQYCHSSALGCQCISRNPAGTDGQVRGPAMVVETVKFLAVGNPAPYPPRVSRVGAIDPSEKVNGCGGAPLPLTA